MEQYVKDAQNRYNAKFDLVQVKLPKGTKNRIKSYTDESFNQYVKRLILSNLERLDNLRDSGQPIQAEEPEKPVNEPTEPHCEPLEHATVPQLLEQYGEEFILSVPGQFRIREEHGTEVLKKLLDYARNQD